MHQPSNSYIIQSAPPRQRGFDTDTKITPAQAQKFRDVGYRFCIRYLSLSGEERPTDLSRQEVMDILDAGLALMAVQHVQHSGWTPSGALGKTNGRYAAAHAAHLGLLPRMNIWLDLEGVDHRASATQVIDYCQHWYEAVKIAGFEPGLYVGADNRLSGSDLYYHLSFQHYWRSMSEVPEVYQRGYQLFQQATEHRFGLSIDENFTSDDHLGNAATWMSKAAP